jgi:hypothetical protein
MTKMRRDKARVIERRMEEDEINSLSLDPSIQCSAGCIDKNLGLSRDTLVRTL